jgi:hypothetical protein
MCHTPEGPMSTDARRPRARVTTPLDPWRSPSGANPIKRTLVPGSTFRALALEAGRAAGGIPGIWSCSLWLSLFKTLILSSALEGSPY